MKKILTLSLLTIAFVSCEQKKETTPEIAKVDYAVFGDSISSEGALSNAEMMEKYERRLRRAKERSEKQKYK